MLTPQLKGFVLPEQGKLGSTERRDATLTSEAGFPMGTKLLSFSAMLWSWGEKRERRQHGARGSPRRAAGKQGPRGVEPCPPDDSPPPRPRTERSRRDPALLDGLGAARGRGAAAPPRAHPSLVLLLLLLQLVLVHARPVQVEPQRLRHPWQQRREQRRHDSWGGAGAGG